MSSIFNEKSPALVVKPLGDLSTRMQVIDAATKLNETINRALSVVWETDADCPETYNNLFKHSPRFSIIEQTATAASSRYSSTGFDHIDSVTDREAAKLIALEKDFHYRFYDDDFHNWESHGFRYKWGGIDDDATIYVASRLAFYKGRGDRAQQFHLTDALAATVDATTESFSDGMIGVVLDDTCDKSAAIELLTMIAEESGQPAFVASTNPAITDELAHSHGGVCHTLADAKLSLTQRELVEMKCLSRTRQIIASSDNLFAQTAALMKGLKLDIVDLS